MQLLAFRKRLFALLMKGGVLLCFAQIVVLS